MNMIAPMMARRTTDIGAMLMSSTATSAKHGVGGGRENTAEREPAEPVGVEVTLVQPDRSADEQSAEYLDRYGGQNRSEPGARFPYSTSTGDRVEHCRPRR